MLNWEEAWVINIVWVKCVGKVEMRHISAWQKNVCIEAGRNGNIDEDGVDLFSVRTRCVAIRDGRKPECVAINAYLKVTRTGTEALGYSEFFKYHHT